MQKFKPVHQINEEDWPENTVVKDSDGDTYLRKGSEWVMIERNPELLPRLNEVYGPYEVLVSEPSDSELKKEIFRCFDHHDVAEAVEKIKELIDYKDAKTVPAGELWRIQLKDTYLRFGVVEGEVFGYRTKKGIEWVVISPLDESLRLVRSEFVILKNRLVDEP